VGAAQAATPVVPLVVLVAVEVAVEVPVVVPVAVAVDVEVDVPVLLADVDALEPVEEDAAAALELPVELMLATPADVEPPVVPDAVTPLAVAPELEVVGELLPHAASRTNVSGAMRMRTSEVRGR
jgi:hypothetical protein